MQIKKLLEKDLKVRSNGGKSNFPGEQIIQQPEHENEVEKSYTKYFIH